MKNFICPLLSLVAANVCAQKVENPNIVLILCDDMGFSDLGCYGSEINTPNIDRLAENGIRFSQFKNTGRSCPSRAALLTGRYQHQAGMGWMAEVDEHRPGYRGQIDDKFPTIAEVLKSGGYSTYMSGKWHVTTTGAYDAPNGSFPVQRGFDRYYGCLHGGGSYYKPEPLYNDLDKVNVIPDDYYYTYAITDSAVSFVSKHNVEKPMFLYLAHYAPHLPLEAPEDYVQKCMKRYSVGYDVLRKERFERMKKLGLVSDDMDLPVFDREFGGKRPSWEELSESQRNKWVRDMATYAAMIEIMDDGIGKVMEVIEKKGMMDNTVFLFMSDNGATDEGGFIKQLMSDLSNTPYRSYKKWTLNGGISSPLIISYGDVKRNGLKGKITNQYAHIIDIMPTCIAMAGLDYPVKKVGMDLEGVDLLPLVNGKQNEKRTLFFEHQGSCAIIDGDWKLVKYNMHDKWYLFNLSSDPFELNDLSSDFPDRMEMLETKWVEWGNSHKVFPLEDKPWNDRINFYLKKNPNQSGRN